MTLLLSFALAAAMIATLCVLGFGIFSLVRGGNPGRSNRLMRMRILFQFIALIVFAILMMLARDM